MDKEIEQRTSVAGTRMLMIGVTRDVRNEYLRGSAGVDYGRNEGE